MARTGVVTDGARNVIPSEVVIKGDCRAFSTEVQRKIETRMRDLVSGPCKAYGAEGDVVYRNEFVPTINSEAETEASIRAARTVAGVVNVDPYCPVCGASEDFAQMLLRKPGCYIFIGNGDTGACSHNLHNPDYDLNDEILETGARYRGPLVQQTLAPH